MLISIVFFPLIGFLVCCLSNKYISNRFSQLFTTILLFVSALFSWIIFINYLFGEKIQIVFLLNWINY